MNGPSELNMDSHNWYMKKGVNVKGNPKKSKTAPPNLDTNNLNNHRILIMSYFFDSRWEHNVGRILHQCNVDPKVQTHNDDTIMLGIYLRPLITLM